MQRELTVRFKDQKRRPRPEHMKPAQELIREHLAACGFHGEWTIDFTKQVRKRGQQKLTVRMQNNALAAVVKPMGQDSAFECFIIPPAGVPTTSAHMALQSHLDRQPREEEPQQGSLAGYSQDDDTLAILLMSLNDHVDFLDQITLQEASHHVRKALGVPLDAGRAGGIFRTLCDRGFLDRVYIGETHLGYRMTDKGRKFADIEPRNRPQNGHARSSLLDDAMVASIRDEIQKAKSQRAAATALDAERAKADAEILQLEKELVEMDAALHRTKSQLGQLRTRVAEITREREALQIPPAGYEAELGLRIVEILSTT